MGLWRIAQQQPPNQPPAKESSVLTEETHEDEELDPVNECQPQEEEPDPDSEPTDDIPDPNSATEAAPSEEHHFQQKPDHLSKKKQQLIGKSATVKSSNSPPITWTVTDDITRAETHKDTKFGETGVFRFHFKHTPKKFGPKKLCSSCIDFLWFFVHLWPGNWQMQLLKLNGRIRDGNVLSNEQMNEISPSEF